MILFCDVRHSGAAIPCVGYDPSRPLPGIAVTASTAEQIAKLQAHNLKFGEGSDLYPPVHRDQMRFGTLASTHLNLLLRCYGANMVSSVTGRRFTASLALSVRSCSVKSNSRFVPRALCHIDVVSDMS